MYGHYELSSPQEISLAGTKPDWRLLATLLGESRGEMSLLDDPRDSVFSYVAGRIVVEPNKCKTAMVFADGESGTIIIRGGSDALCKVRSFVASFGDGFIPGDHVHLDSIGNEQFISTESAALVLWMM